MRNVDAKDGSQVMMDEKNVWEFFWMRNMDAKGWFTSYDGWELWMRSMFENLVGREVCSRMMMDEKYGSRGWMKNMKQRMVGRIMMDDKYRWERYDGWEIWRQNCDGLINMD